MKKNNGFRVLSLVLSLAFIFTLAGQMYTSAEDGVPFTQVTESVDETYVKNMGSNLLSGKTPKVYATLNDTKEVIWGVTNADTNNHTVFNTGWGEASVMTDGTIFSTGDNNKNCQIQTTAYATNQYYGKYSVKLIYDLEDVYNINKLLFVSWLSNSTEDKRVQEYEFYISENADTVDALFTEGNKVTDIPTLADYSKDDVSTAAQAFTAESAVSGRYVGIKLIKGSPANNNFQFIINELGVYGNKQAVRYDYNSDKTVDIRDLVRLKMWSVNNTTAIDLSAKGEFDPTEDSASALAELRKHLLSI